MLMHIGHLLDQRTNTARFSILEIAEASGMSIRHATRILKQLEVPRPGYPAGIVIRVAGGLGRGNKSTYSFVGFKCEKVDLRSPKNMTFTAEKDDIRGNTIRNEDLSKKRTTLPNPPFQGGNRFRSLTSREGRRLCDLIDRLQHRHLDHYGHNKFDEFNRLIRPMEFEQALELACAQLLLPIESAWAAAKAAGLGDARKKDPARASA